MILIYVVKSINIKKKLKNYKNDSYNHNKNFVYHNLIITTIFQPSLILFFSLRNKF